MEDILRVALVLLQVLYLQVLILVLMEDTLRATLMPGYLFNSNKS